MLGGGPTGSLGEWPSWIVGAIGCVAIVFSLFASRRRRRRYGFPLRPMWAEIALGAAPARAVLGAVWVANSYPWPEALAAQYAEANDITVPPGGLIIPTGIPSPSSS